MKRRRVLIFPNPVATTLCVQLPTRREEITISIVDMNGRTASNTSFGTQKGINFLKVDMHTLVSGLYLVYVQSQEATIIKKILIN